MPVYRVPVLGDYKNQGWTTSPVANQALWSNVNKPQTNPTAPPVTPLIQDVSTGNQCGLKAGFFDVGPDEVITSLVVNMYLSTGTGTTPLNIVTQMTGTGPPGFVQNSLLLAANIAASWQTITNVNIPAGTIYPSDIAGKNMVAFLSQSGNTGTNKVFAVYLSVVTVGGQPKIFPNRPSQAVRTAAFR